ncbi:hypothetical protein HNP84_009469 [Thermocatellispora tengchongensis]|uniref:Sel1 repeat family protein n=1 Tax=Thermocatellispora tengchongensis TaxID=1073253 RepID=A0A840PUY2_9ACTN|nr:sel1 repeat family protein [Thermocatellispora tengchongensis]MBB5139705.1 hypothetical protein [Thermocatellispora tengchongensis]
MDEEDRRAARSRFVAQLNELRSRAGAPSLPMLEKLSERARQQGHQRRVLAKSTTHDILAGRRAQVPEWPWVMSFVLTCQEAAEMNGLDPAALGSVHDWLARWSVARGEAPDPSPGLGGHPATLSGGHHPATPPAGRQGAAPPPGPESAPQPEPPAYLERYGRTGVRLLRHARAGSAEACFQLGIITLLDGPPDAAGEWLRRAVAAGHGNAALLLAREDRAALAAELACQYGREYAAYGERKAYLAQFYYRLAAEHGHEEARDLLAALTARLGAPAAAEPVRRGAYELPLAAPVDESSDPVGLPDWVVRMYLKDLDGTGQE